MLDGIGSLLAAGLMFSVVSFGAAVALLLTEKSIRWCRRIPKSSAS
jgi:hypothetical protein